MTDTNDTVKPSAAAQNDRAVQALAIDRGVTADDVAKVAGQGLRPSTVATIATRFDGVVYAAGQRVEGQIARVDRAVNGVEPIGQVIVTAATGALQHRPGHPQVVNRPDGIYVPGAADYVLAAGNGRQPGIQAAMAQVAAGQASGAICHQASGRISGGTETVVVNSCVRPGGRVSVSASISF